MKKGEKMIKYAIKTSYKKLETEKKTWETDHILRIK